MAILIEECIKPYDSFVSKGIWLQKRIICAVGFFSPKDQNSIPLGVDGMLIICGNYEAYFTILRQLV